MLILSILAVCINAQSFGDLVKLLASSLSRDSDAAILVSVKKKKRKALLSVNLHTTAKVLNFEKLSKELLFSWYVNKCQVWRRTSCTRGTINGLGIFHSRKACLNIPGENSTCCFNKTCLCFALRARSVDTSLNPKAFLSQYIRAVENLLRCWCPVVLRALCSVCLPPASAEETANGAFVFSDSRDAALMSSLPFLCPSGPGEPAVLSGSGIPCLGRRGTAGRGIASLAGQMAACPPISGPFEVTELHIKGSREWAALMNHCFHDFFVFIMTLPWPRYQIFWGQNWKEDLRDSSPAVIPVHILPWIEA